MIDLSSSLLRIKDLIHRLDRDQIQDLEHILNVVVNVGERDINYNEKRQGLRQLRKVIERKVTQELTHSSAMKINENFLRNLRNDLVHGKSLNRYEPEELLDIQRQFWHALHKSATRWQFNDLKSFLSYCIPHVGFSSAKTQAGIVKYYEAIFFSLPEELRAPILAELVIRIFTEPQFRESFEMSNKQK